MLSACIRLYSAKLFTLAFFENSGVGLKTRFSTALDALALLMIQFGWKRIDENAA
jgi:hypothetical protein